MEESYLTKREFDGFTGSFRDEMQRVGSLVTQTNAKIDTLVNGRIEEARVMGEIIGQIKAILARLEKHDHDMEELQRAIELVKSQDNERHSSESKSRLGWFLYLTAGIIVALVTAFIVKN